MSEARNSSRLGRGLKVGRRRLLLAGTAIAVAAAGCGGSSGHHGLAPPRPTATTVTGAAPASTSVTSIPKSSSTTTPQTSGQRTVLSPTGLNVRAQPATTAQVLGTAAQGTVLTVLAHSDQAGGWFQVKGATVTGWISDNPALTAQGKFNAYVQGAGQFGTLYPATWSTAASPPASVVFRAPSGGETIVVTTAMDVGQLGVGRPGYRRSGSEQVVACGITSYLYTYVQSGGSATTAPPPGVAAPQQDLAQVRLTLDPQHALGIDANLTDISQLQTVRDFVNAITFPFSQCEH